MSRDTKEAFLNECFTKDWLNIFLKAKCLLGKQKLFLATIHSALKIGRKYNIHIQMLVRIVYNIRSSSAKFLFR